MASPQESTTGILISFEGSEGAGKSTQIARLAQRIQNLGREVISTREPGGTEIGEQVRNIIVHNSKGDEMCAETELLLFAAARAQLVRETIAPSLLRGTVVLSDRFLDSTTVYQGIARNLAMGPVNEINRFAVGEVMPDLTVVIDVPTEVSLARIRQRASDLPDRMERENIDFYEKVRVGYLVLAKSMPERIVVIDGTQSEEEIANEIWKAVGERFFGVKGEAERGSRSGGNGTRSPGARKVVAKKTLTRKATKPAAAAKKSSSRRSAKRSSRR